MFRNKHYKKLKIDDTKLLNTRNKHYKDKYSQKRKLKPTGRSVSGVWPFRGDSSVPYESALERDFIARYDFFLNVLDVYAQPVEIPFIGYNGNTYTYTPDFLVQYRLAGRSADNYPKPLLIEVKYEKDWKENWRSWLPKWKAAYRYAKDNGLIFKIYDENRIRDLVLENIQYLERYKRRQFDECESEVVLNTVCEMGQTTAQHLLARHFMGYYRGEGITHIWHLVATRRLDCDVHKPLGLDTILWVPDD